MAKKDKDTIIPVSEQVPHEIEPITKIEINFVSNSVCLHSKNAKLCMAIKEEKGRPIFSGWVQDINNPYITQNDKEVFFASGTVKEGKTFAIKMPKYFVPAITALKELPPLPVPNLPPLPKSKLPPIPTSKQVMPTPEEMLKQVTPNK